MLRNLYGSVSRPCLKCSANEGLDLCSIYEKQCSSCPIYANWVKTKKSAYDLRLPLPLENHSQEVWSTKSDSLDVEKTAANLHKHMFKILRPLELRVYKLLYIEEKSEEEVAKIMGYITNEAGRIPGYRQIKNITKSIIEKVKIALTQIDIVT